MRLILIDNYDSFTFNLYQQLLRVGAKLQTTVTVLRNDSISIVELLNQQPSAIVISPGPGRPDDAGISLELIRKTTNIPLLGVCLGHQAIAQAYGATIVRSPKALHGQTSPITHTCRGLFQFVKNPIAVARYHSLVIDKTTLSTELQITAATEDGTIMAIEHKHLPLWGVQFHPESFLTEGGDQIIENFLAQAVERAA